LGLIKGHAMPGTESPARLDALFAGRAEFRRAEAGEGQPPGKFRLLLRRQAGEDNGKAAGPRGVSNGFSHLCLSREKQDLEVLAHRAEDICQHGPDD